MVKKDLESKFDEKVKELEVDLPSKKINVNCAELTLTSILEVLGVDNHIFHNIAKLATEIILEAGFTPE